MDMTLESVHVHYAIWFKTSVLVTIGFAVAAPFLAVRSSRPLSICLLASIASLSATWYGLLQTMSGLSLMSNDGRHAAAAGIAEAQVPTILGLVVSSGLLVILAVIIDRFSVSRELLAVPAALACVIVVSVALELVVAHRAIAVERPHPLLLLRWSAVGAALTASVALTTAGLVGASFSRSRPIAARSRAPFLFAAACCGVGAYALWLKTQSFVRFAIGE